MAVAPSEAAWGRVVVGRCCARHAPRGGRLRVWCDTAPRCSPLPPSRARGLVVVCCSPPVRSGLCRNVDGSVGACPRRRFGYLEKSELVAQLAVKHREADVAKKLQEHTRRIEPVFDAHRGYTDETWRIERLRSVFNSAAERVENEDSDGLWDGAIRLMYDRKGELTVFWRSDEDFLVFARLIKDAWSDHDEYTPIQHISPADLPFDVAVRRLREAQTYQQDLVAADESDFDEDGWVNFIEWWATRS